MRNLFCKTQRLTEQQSRDIGREFEENQEMIDRMVTKHIKRYGGDYEALFSRATDTLIVAWLRHDPTRSPWQKYISEQIKLGFINLHKETVNRKHLSVTNAHETLQEMTYKEAREHDDFYDDLRQWLSEDSRALFELYIEDVTSKSPTKTFSLFRKIMLKMKWSRPRINMAIMELRDILTSITKEGM